MGSILVLLACGVLYAPKSFAAPTTSIKFDVSGFQVTRVWTAASLGIPGVSPDPTCMSSNSCTDLGGIAFSPDGNTLYVVAGADKATSALYAVTVARNNSATNEVTDLLGPATHVFDGMPPPGGGGLDAGLDFGPQGTLFYSYVPANFLGERVGTTERQFDLGANPPNVPNSIAGFTFSPFRSDPGTGFGVLQINTLSLPDVYELSLMPADSGFFTPTAKTLFVSLPTGSLGNMHYIPSAPYTGNLMYEAYNAGELHYIAIDSATGLPIDSTTGQPMLGTANPLDTRFARGFGSDTNAGPFGLEFDPRNNDLFVSTAEGDPSIFNSIIQIQGFSHVTTTTTTATTQPTTTSSSTSTTTTSSTSTSIITSTSTSSTTTTMPLCILDVDKNGTGDVSTDVVYINRYLLGLAPVPPSYRQIDDTIPPDATIAANINGILSSLDVDMNGTVQSATDVVYIRRHLLGLITVPQSFRDLDPNHTIPPDSTINANTDALCP